MAGLMGLCLDVMHQTGKMDEVSAIERKGRLSLRNVIRKFEDNWRSRDIRMFLTEEIHVSYNAPVNERIRRHSGTDNVQLVVEVERRVARHPNELFGPTTTAPADDSLLQKPKQTTVRFASPESKPKEADATPPHRLAEALKFEILRNAASPSSTPQTPLSPSGLSLHIPSTIGDDTVYTV